MSKYPKLVRDKIPEMLKSKGQTAEVHSADDKEYWQRLKDKLVEEFLKDESDQELADVLEVVYAIGDVRKLSPSDLEKMRKKKNEERGGFKKRLVIDKVILP